MNVDFNEHILDLKGLPLKGEGEADLTLGEACVQGLLAVDRVDEKLSSEEKVKIFKLANKLSPGGEIDMSIDDLAYVKKCVGRTMVTIVVGRVDEIFDRSKTSTRKPTGKAK